MNQKPTPAGLAGRLHARLDAVPHRLNQSWTGWLDWLTEPWKRLKPVLEILFYCRFGVAVLAIAAGLLWLSGQGREIAVRVGDEPIPTLAAVAGAFFWAFHVWYDGRRVLRKQFGPDRGEQWRGSDFKTLVDIIPRLLGSGAYLIAASSALIAWYKLKFTLKAWHAALVVLNLAGAWLFYQLMKHRKVLQARWLGSDKSSVLDLEPWVTPITWTYGIVMFLAATLFPVRFGFAIGSLGIVFFALSSIVYFGSWLVRETTGQHDFAGLASGSGGFPVMTALFLWAVLLTFWPFNDNHRLPLLDGYRPRPTLAQWLSAWQAQAPSVHDSHSAMPYQPMVLVATAGGGIRAGYWTAAVLGQLSDAAPGLQRSLFAISGVSGGSVGAAAYTATLRELGPSCSRSASRGQAADCLTGPLLRALSSEFLAPVVARMFYPDLLQRFLPIALLPDRATALSDGWQHSWATAMGRPQTAGLAAPLSGLVPANGNAGVWLPVLLLNSTHVETGQRVIASNLDLYRSARARDGTTPAFLDAVDLTSLLNADVSLGTAALDSARFTYVSPPGTLPCPNAGLVSFCQNGHVVDGGYFENFGALSARQLLEAIPTAYTPIRPLVVLISNDAAVGPGIERNDPPDRLPSEGLANETLAPVRALLGARESRGTLAAKELRASVPAAQYFHFRMMLQEGQAEPALGWALDRGSERLLRRMLTCTQPNQREFDRLLAALGVPEPERRAAVRCRDGGLAAP